IGTNAAGSAGLGGGVFSGIYLFGNVDTTIRNNLIAGNTSNGISVTGDATRNSTGTIIQGNRIGTAIGGTSAVANAGGIALGAFGNSYVLNSLVGSDGDGIDDALERNLISGNTGNGVQISGANATNNVIAGNYIGTDISGGTALPNQSGVSISEGTTGNTIGGSSAATGNVIAGNTLNGIVVTGGANDNTIQGNYIGTNAAGSAALANDTGIFVQNVSGTIIGGNTAGVRNIISGNSEGIAFWGGTSIADPGVTGTLIQGNSIGVGSDGETAIPNSGSWGGIVIRNWASSNTIGGPNPGQGNTIANNNYGITLFTGYRNAIVGNSIYNTTTLGIYLNTVGANDADDPDSSSLDPSLPNDGQNYPLLSSAIFDNALLTIDYSIDSALANSAYPIQIDFYGADNGQGQTYLGRSTAGSPGPGSLEIAEPPVSAGDTIVATATDANGNTSLFSAAITATTLGGDEQSGPIFTVNSTLDPGDGTCTSGECTLREAIDAANTQPGPNTINFAIPGGGVQTIAPSSALPIISDPVVIDGYSQPGATANSLTVGTNAVLQIELDGSLIGGSADGLALRTSNSSIRGLAIGRFNGAGISVSEADNIIAGNYIGTDADGTLDRSNRGDGIFVANFSQPVGANNNRIGGPNPADRNLISANGNQPFGGDRNGITLDQVQNTLIQGNYIGTDAGGTLALGNYAAGIGIFRGFSNRVIGNLISANAGDGIAIGDTFVNSGNIIQGNQIGTNRGGAPTLGNLRDGIQLATFNSLIGGSNPGEGNLIAGNGESGIRMLGGSGNRLSRNQIYTNGAAITLLNGANNSANAPTVTAAVPDAPASGQSNIQGWITGATPNSVLTLEFFSAPNCALGGGAAARSFLASLNVSVGDDGNAPFQLNINSALAAGSFVTATGTDAAGNSSALALCAPVGPDNTEWFSALPLNAAADIANQPIALSGQVRWYRLPVQANSRAVVNLGNLPAGYDIALFNDLGARAIELAAAAENDLVGALALAQTEINYDQIEASNFITNSLAPEVYSPEAYSSTAFFPNSYRPDLLADAVVSPFKTSPFKTSEATADLVIDSGLLSYSDIEGTLPRTLTLSTYDESGELYIAVYGRNGAFEPSQNYSLNTTTAAGQCSALVAPNLSNGLLQAQAGNYRTIFITDMARMAGSATAKTTLTNLLDSFRQRSEIAGVVVDVGADAYVAAAHTLADANAICPDAQNFVADGIKRIIDDYRSLNPDLAYVVLVGGDSAIPFYRYRDQALLGNESEFSPPVQNESAAEAALRLGYIIGQDEYGASVAINFGTTHLPIPDLAVGRLVENAAEATALINAYLATNGVIQPTGSFVSGYDFHYESSQIIADTLSLGTGAPVNSLLSTSSDSYQSPDAWSAAELTGRLSASNYDLQYLAGHFSDGALLAADYTTSLRAAELAANPAYQQFGGLVVSPGCHSGYNTPDDAAISGVTDQPDWAQFFAGRGTSLIAGTGYQYGDTQFTQFAEELYVRFFEQLRFDTDRSSPAGDEVPIGTALVLAKQRYLIDSAIIRGIDKKTLMISALFGLPMLRVDMQGQRIAPEPIPALPANFPPLTPLIPGETIYRVQTSDVTVEPNLSVAGIILNTLNNDQPVVATYIQGSSPEDVIARPAEPVLPFVQYSVGRQNQQLRGALLLEAPYSELNNVLPLTGAPATELRGVHMTFPSETFYPEKWWTVNYLDALTGASDAGGTRLQLTPSQFLADPGSIRGTIRYYDQPVSFRLYYSDQTAAFSDGSNPALAGPPALPSVQFERDGAIVRFRVATGGSLPLREVYVTYSADSGPFAGRWQSLLLSPDAGDPTLWVGQLTIPAGSDNVQFFVQAANAAGFTALNTNLGLYFNAGGQSATNDVIAPPPLPGAISGDNAVATSLGLNLPANPTYGLPGSFTATLSTASAADRSGQELILRVGSQTAGAFTDANGAATFNLTMIGTGSQPVAVSFGGTTALLPAQFETSVSVAKQQPNLSAPDAVQSAFGTQASLAAALTDAAGGIRSARLYLQVNGQVISALTNPEGRADLAFPSLPPGIYQYSVSYLQVPTAGGLVEENDPRYLPASSGGMLNVTGGIETTIESGPTGSISDSAVTISFSGSGGSDVSFMCSLSFAGAPAGYEPCTSPVRYVGLANGNYTFSVQAITADQSVDPTPPSISWEVAQFLYRAHQQGARVWIERNVVLAGLGDYDGSQKDGWALVGRTNGAADNGQLRGFYVENGVPYALVFNRSKNKGDRCILLTPRSLDVVKKGQTRMLLNLNDNYAPCPAAFNPPLEQLP
ncbi:MAG: CSLREA domain-containing protein, partial [Oscillochloris sp.]|nr:CSLREA domain-containing protein [Oscillochloris sp.]